MGQRLLRLSNKVKEIFARVKALLKCPLRYLV